MLLAHSLCNCIRCEEELEIFMTDVEEGAVECPYCGYINDLDDERLEIWEEEW